MKKLIIELVLMYTLGAIMVGCDKTPKTEAVSIPATSTAVPSSSEDEQQRRIQDDLARLHAAQQRYRQTGILPDPTQNKIVK